MRAAFVAIAAGLLGVSVVHAQQAPRPTPPRVETQSITVRGPVVRVQNDHFVVRGANNKEVILYHSPQTRFVINGKTGAFRDLRVGTEINAGYVRRGDRLVVNTVTVGAGTGGGAGGATVAATRASSIRLLSLMRPEAGSQGPRRAVRGAIGVTLPQNRRG